MSITSLLSMNELGPLFQRANAGDPEARRQVQALGPSLTESVGAPGENYMNQLQGGGMATSMLGALPAARQVGPQSPQSLHQNAGGGGVSVQDAETGGEKTDWGSLLQVFGGGLTEIANAVGNPRAPIAQSPGYEMALEKIKAGQVDQLQRRHQMWDDAYTQSQALPQEALADPAFAGLSQAKAALDKDMLDGKIDNEKNVSNFLTEMSRHKTDLAGLIQQSQLRQQQAAEDAMAQHRAGAPELYGPSEGTKWEHTLGKEAEDVRQFGETEKRLREQTAATEGWHRFAAEQGRQERQDTLESQKWNNAARALEATLSATIKQYAAPDKFGEPGAAPDVAEKNALIQHTDDILYLAQHLGIRAVKHPQYAVISINDQPFDAFEAVQRLVAEIRARGGQ